MGAKAPSLPKYNPPNPPPFVPLDIGGVDTAAIAAAQKAYALSDIDFATQHPELAAAQTTFQKQMLQDIQGQPTVPTEVQNQLMAGGLQSAARSMGATGAFGTGVGAGGTGGPTAGQAAVARNFGVNVSNYLNQQKQIGAQELAMNTSMFPRREFGLGPQGTAQAMITQNTDLNNYNWGVYGAQVQAEQFKTNLAAQQAGLKAGAQNASSGAMMGLAGSGISAIGSIAGAAAI